MNFIHIPQIKVSSVEEYFNLPSTTREWYGFYKKPYSLPWEFAPNYKDEKGWNNYYSTIKKQYPLQYFFREWLFSFENPLYSLFKKYIHWPIKDVKYNIKIFLRPFYKRWRATLPRHQYKDISQLIVDSNFALLLDFYYEEVLDGHVDWDADELHKTFRNELEKHVDWIENQQPILEKEIESALTEAHDNKKFSKETGKIDFNKTYKCHNKLEKIKEQRITIILTWMIKNRVFFWS